MKKILFIVFCLGLLLQAHQSFAGYPYSFTNGTPTDATTMNADLDYFENKYSTSSGHDHDGVNSKLIINLSGVTNYGTITNATWHGNTIDVIYGGTGLAAFNQGDILAATADNVIGKIAKNVTATRYLANTGINNMPQYDTVNLTNGVSGVLPIANGGTNSSSTTYCDLTTNVTGVLPIVNGGTGGATGDSGLKLGQLTGTYASQGPTANYIYATRWICAKTCTVSNIVIQFNQPTAGLKYRMGIYTDSSIYPATLLAECGELTVPATPNYLQGVGTLTTPQSLTGGSYYWLVVQTDGATGLSMFKVVNITSANWNVSGARNYAALPASFPGAIGAGEPIMVAAW